MKRGMILLVVIGMTLFWSCQVNKDDLTQIEEEILALINADDSTFSLEGFSDGMLDFFLGKPVPDASTFQDGLIPDVFDSNYVWRFRRSDMQVEREVNVDVQNDTSAFVSFTFHVTGNFHTLRYSRHWTSDSTWEQDTLVSETIKPIDITINRYAQFRYREEMGMNQHHWRYVGSTVAYGTSSNATVGISALSFDNGDTTLVLDDFSNTFFGPWHPILFYVNEQGRLTVHVTNSEVPDSAESVIGHWGFHRHLSGVREFLRFHYAGSEDDGTKDYVRFVVAPQYPYRRFAGMIQVLDLRTLFDESYPYYNAAVLNFHYWLRRHPHHP